MSSLNRPYALLLSSLTAALLISGCSENDSNNSTAIDDDNSTILIDSDGDGLDDELERSTYFTSPTLVDTDGDGISDGDEVNEKGFDPAVNLYRFNPLIADLPTLSINIETIPDLVLRFTDSSGSEKSFSNASGGESVETDTRSHTGGVSVTVGAEVGMEVGIFGGAESKATFSVTGSYSTTESTTTENRDTWEKVTTDSSFASRDTDGASIRIGVTIKNNSNLTYSLDHISLLASYIQSDARSKPIATLNYDGGANSFQRTSFSPGEKSNLLLFSYDDLDLGTALEVLKDSRNMIVQPALYELLNEDGSAIAFDAGDVNSKTAEILIDYGIERPQERYDVSVMGSLGSNSLELTTLLKRVLQIDVLDSGGIKSVRGIAEDSTSRWVILLTHNDGFIDKTDIYDINKSAYTLSDITLYPSDKVSLIYLADADGDSVGIREEVLNGTDPLVADTDGDGLSDAVEIRNAQLVNSINLIDPLRYPSYSFSNPLLADADGDGLNDLQERERGLDPNNADTDGDGIIDILDFYNGQLPIAADFTLTLDASNTLRLTGSATAQAGTTITNIDVNWGDGNSNSAIGSSSSLNINLSHPFATPNNENDYTLIITVTNSEGTTAQYTAAAKLYAEVHVTDFYNGWNEDRHIRQLADVNGDSWPDIVAFGDNGVDVALNNQNGGFLQRTEWLNGNYGAGPVGGGFIRDVHPRFIVDFDNDGLKDILAINDSGLIWSRNEGNNSFGAAQSVVNNFSPAQYWNLSDTPRMLADVDGNGIMDMVGFGYDAVYTYLGGGVNQQVITATREFTYNLGWRNDIHYRFVTDIDGDGRADIIGLGSVVMVAALGQSDGTFKLAEVFKSGSAALSENNGWDPDRFPVKIVDVNSDGMKDIVGFGSGSLLVLLNQSSEGSVRFSDPMVWNSNYVLNSGWQLTDNAHPRFIEDIDGDGYKDLAGFGSGALTFANNLSKRGEQRFNNTLGVFSGSFTTDNNWRAPNNGRYNSRYVQDINNDGRADAVGFSNSGVIIQLAPQLVQPGLQL